MHVLVVEDDESVAAFLEAFLSGDGRHRVTVACSGEQAIDLLETASQPFDLFLIDIQMPGMNGIETVRHIRGRPAYDLTPIIMLTAMDQKRYIDDAFDAGTWDYLTKPINLAELQKKLNLARKNALEKRRTKRQRLCEGDVDGEFDDVKSFRFDHAFALKTTKDALEYREFENYASQLHGRRFGGITFYAVGLVDAKKHYDSLASDHFIEMIENVSRSLVSQGLPYGGKVSYRGSGTFILISNKKIKEDWAKFEDGINQALTNLDGTVPPSEKKIITSNQIRSRLLSASDPLASLAAAMEGLDWRFEELRREKLTTRRTLQPKNLSKESGRLDQRAYELAFEDLRSFDENPKWNGYLSRKLFSRRQTGT